MPYQVIYRPKGAPEERLLLVGVFQDDLYAALRRKSWLVEQVLDGREALQEAARREYGVVLCSLRMDGAWGLDVLEAILKADPLTPVLISTHERNPRIVVEAMRRGAFDYVVEPYADLAYVLDALARAVRHRAALRRGRALREELGRGTGPLFAELLGRSDALRELCERVRQVAPAPAPVLLEGESGAGKELVARALHQGGTRRHGPFVAVHCGAISESLLESELFGHEKGAFTGAESTRVGVFEAARGGTLFLDEIGHTSPACQTKLLRVLESNAIRRVGASRELGVDVRVLSATNAPLAGLVAAGRFRQDLFYRLNVITLRVPSLRERREDIPLLSHAFAERFAQEAGKPFAAFTDAALAALAAHPFPGNVRELRNAIERAVVFSRGPVIGSADLPESFRNPLPRPGAEEEYAGGVDSRGALSEMAAREANRVLSGVPAAPSLETCLAQIEKSCIERALLLSGGNRSRAAKLLKLKRTTLLQKMARLDLGGSKVPRRRRS